MDTLPLVNIDTEHPNETAIQTGQTPSERLPNQAKPESKRFYSKQAAKVKKIAKAS